MINVLINESDKYYLSGMMYLLRNIFSHEYNENVNFHYEMSPNNIWNANIILIKILKGEEKTCKPEFKLRNQGVIIGLIDYDSQYNYTMPSCYRDIIFISRKSSFKKMHSIIIKAWNKNHQLSHYPRKYSCVNCTHVQMSQRENSIAHELMSGQSAHKIAKEYNISEKTVYAHKYTIMRKFNIENTKDFISFLRYLWTREAKKH